MNLSFLPNRYAVCRLSADAELPVGCLNHPFASATRTDEELSLIVPESAVEPGWRSEGEWRILKVAGPLGFDLVGILADLASILAAVGVSIFAASTFNTDYLLVKEDDLDLARHALTQAGHVIASEP